MKYENENQGLHACMDSLTNFSTLDLIKILFEMFLLQLTCKLVAIFLHYFFMTTFSWMFVETMHLYRMMTEIKNINQGSMKFYYVIGYVLPGIILGLAVGLDTEHYGKDRL